MEKNKPPKASTTVFLIFSTMLLSLALFGCGVYSLYISIGFRFLNRSAIAGLNTASLYTYPNSGFGTGSGTMIGLILVSIVMVTLGIAMVIIFFKQLPLYKQIKFVVKMPNVKYKEYSQQAKKSVIVWSIIAYITTIAFSVFALIVVYRSGVSANYLWILATLYFIVLGLSIASMVLMFVKIAQLSKIRKTLKENEKNSDVDFGKDDRDETNKREEIQADVDTPKPSENGNNADFLCKDAEQNQKNIQKIEEQSSNENDIAKLEKNKAEISQGDSNVIENLHSEKPLKDLNSGEIANGQGSKAEQNTGDIVNFKTGTGQNLNSAKYGESDSQWQTSQMEQIGRDYVNLEQPRQPDSNTSQSADGTQPSIVVNIPEQNKEQKQNIGERLFTDGIFELGDQLVKLRELHVSGLISNEEYTMLREKWIDAVLSEPLFGKKRTKNKNKSTARNIIGGDISE